MSISWTGIRVRLMLMLQGTCTQPFLLRITPLAVRHPHVGLEQARGSCCKREHTWGSRWVASQARNMCPCSIDQPEIVWWTTCRDSEKGGTPGYQGGSLRRGELSFSKSKAVYANGTNMGTTRCPQARQSSGAFLER